MTIAFCIGVHDRVDDLDAHLDILSFYPDPYRLIVAYSHEDTPSETVARWSKVAEVVRVFGQGFATGPLLAFVAGLRKAAAIGCEWMIYRNADDWLFNHAVVTGRLFAMQKAGAIGGGYNWLTKNTMSEFAMNEVTVRVADFMKDVDWMESYFRHSSDHLLCEFKFARWMRSACGDEGFYRIPGRERSPGVGYEVESILSLLASQRQIPEPSFFKEVENNHRFFHSDWQLIGSHDNAQRGMYYHRLRHAIPYAAELETKTQFKRWLSAWANSGEWNMPITPRPSGAFRLQTSVPKPLPRARLASRKISIK